MGRLLDFRGKGVGLGHFRYIQTRLKLSKLVNRFTVSRAAGDQCILIMGVLFNQVADTPITLSSAESQETLETEQPGQVATGRPLSDQYASSAAISPTPLPSTFAGKIQSSVL